MSNLTGTEHLMGEVMEIIGHEINAAKAKSTNFVPVLVGDPGIGKSESLKALAADMNMGAAIFSLGALPMEWFSGLPEFGNTTIDPSYSVEKKTEIRTTEWTMSDLIRSINIQTEKAVEEGKEGLVVLLDDIHLVEPIVQKYLFEFFQNKTLQNFKIHEKAYFVGAMNGKDSAGLEGFLSAVLNRMALYFVKFDAEYWYANIGANLHPYVASFARNGVSDKYFIGANSTDGASPSPRAWTELSQIIFNLEDSYKISSSDSKKKTSGAGYRKIDLVKFNSVLRIMTEARVGIEATVEFMKHVKMFQTLDFDSILQRKIMVDVPLDIGDQVLMAFIVRYMKDASDAEFVVDMLKHNQQQRTFISVFINEFDILIKGLSKMPKSKIKDAVTHLNKIIVDKKRVDSDLVDVLVEGLLDIK